MFIEGSSNRSSAKGATFTFALVRQFSAHVASIAGNLIKRRSVAQLAHLDDRMLKDIGLTRADVASALLTPLTDDPSRHLTSLRPDGGGQTVQGPRHQGHLSAGSIQSLTGGRVRRPDSPVAFSTGSARAA